MQAIAKSNFRSCYAHSVSHIQLNKILETIKIRPNAFATMSNQQVTYSGNMNGQNSDAPPATAGGDNDDAQGMAPNGEIQVRQCKYTQKCTVFHSQSTWKRACESFDDMNLRESLLRGIYNVGFEKPSPIQARAIEPCCTGAC